MTIKRLTLSLLLCLTATAELQNVIVNGGYMVNDADRFSRVIQEFTYTKNGLTIPAFRLGPPIIEATADNQQLSHPQNYVALENIMVPEPQKVKDYPDHVRLFFTFYARSVALSKGAQTRLSLITYVNDERALVIDDPGESWRLYLIDMGSNAGNDVSVRFVAPWLARSIDGNLDVRVDIALPRIVTWHGPYYAGWGGLSMPGRHGNNQVHGEKNLDFPSVKPSDIVGEPLMLRWFDFVERSTLSLVSSAQDAQYQLPSGIHCIALRLGSDTEKGYVQKLVDGEVESWAIDIVPDFTRDDDARLLELGEKLEATDKNR